MSVIDSIEFPRMFAVRQKFVATTPVNIPKSIDAGFAKIDSEIKPGTKIAIAVGSRGVSNLQAIVKEVVAQVQARGAEVFIVPAMGSHGGGTPEEQTNLLGGYGVSESTLGVAVRAEMGVRTIGKTADGLDVVLSEAALDADGIVVVNRIKPHTNFKGTIGSGILKMMVVGLGKHTGAIQFHRAALRCGYEPVIKSFSRVIRSHTPILCGVGIVENETHETIRIEVIHQADLEEQEALLFQEASRLMPRIPFNDLDLLIVDRIGKNISGAGMDPNVTGRGDRGNLTPINGESGPNPRLVFVRELTSETHGNAIGVGMADFTTKRLVDGMAQRVTAVNAVTALSVGAAKIPIYFDTDREVLGHALAALGLEKSREAKIVRIADTLSLGCLEASESFAESWQGNDTLSQVSELQEIRFDTSGNLLPITGP